MRGLSLRYKMALTLTEALIRSRVNLTHENLEDIKSLSLPGTYHEKIVSIGTSLRRFSRLKALDLSRNALESLQGLEHLQLLEKLNLYYNNVSSLEELKRLKVNTSLKEIDLRLNPVTRNEPDYRLYLIHMLPNLQKLDDRAVRDRERQAALMHFSSSQTLEMTSLPPKTQADNKSPLPRTEMMAKLMRCPLALANDDAIIDMVNHQNGELSKQHTLTGSSAREDRVEDYSLSSLAVLDQSTSRNHRGKNFENTQVHMAGSANSEPPSLSNNEDPRFARYKEWYPNIMSMSGGEGVHKIGEAHKKDPNLLFSDEVEASSKYRGQGYFTPNPKGESNRPKNDMSKYQDPLCASDPIPKTDRGEFYSAKQRQSRQDVRVRTSQDDLEWNRPRLNRTNSVPAKEPSNSLHYGDAKEKTLIYSLLNLVDRYWNGSKSLHKHSKFIEQALKYLSEYTLTREHVKEDETNKLKCRVETLEEQISVLRKSNDGSSEEMAAAKETELRAALRKSHDDIKRMHSEIRHYISENRILHRKLDGPNFSSNCDNYTSDNGPGQSMTVDELQHKNDILSHELEGMKAKVRQYCQLQDLASMLQESHKSLVETNDHLLRELHDTKEKHHQEIQQMHWSYNQLKSTMGYSSMLKSFTLSPNNSHSDPSQRPAVTSYKDYQERDGLGTDKSLNRLSDCNANRT